MQDILALNQYCVHLCQFELRYLQIQSRYFAIASSFGSAIRVRYPVAEGECTDMPQYHSHIGPV